MAIKKWCKICNLLWDKCGFQSQHRNDFSYHADVQPGGRKFPRFRESWPDYAAAVKWIREKQVENKSLLDSAKDKKRLSMGEFINLYWDLHCVPNMRNPQRHEKYRLNRLRNFFDCTLIDFDITMADKFIKTMDGYDIDYKNRIITTLKAMTNWGFSRGYFTVNPLQHFKKLKGIDVNTVRTRWLSDSEISLLVSACDDQETKDMILFGLNTGFRRENIVAVQIEDIDMDYGFITARRTKSGKPYEVPILQSFKPQLLRMIGGRASGRLFVSSSWGFGKRFRRAAKKAQLYTAAISKLDRVTPHVLRHTFAAHMIKAGKNIYAVSKWLGHSSIKMTEQVYGHLCKKFQREHVSDVQIGPVDTSPTIETRSA